MTAPSPSNKRTLPLPSRRSIAAVGAVALLALTGLWTLGGRAQASSVVIPETGIWGKNVAGTIDGQPANFATMLFKVNLDDTVAYMFCIDLHTVAQLGVEHVETAWLESNVKNLPQVTQILAMSNATTSKDPIEITATQAAIWHFSDGFELSAKDPRNDPAVIARYQQLVAAAADATGTEPAATLTATPRSAQATQGGTVTFDVATTAVAPLTIEVSDPRVTVHRVNEGKCDTTSVLTTFTGSQKICAKSPDPLGDVSITLRTEAAEVNAGRIFVHPGNQKLIIGKSGLARSSEVVTASWTENKAPTVSVECPVGGMRYDTPIELTANGVDPDGGLLGYEWLVNGVVASTSPTATLTLTRSDTLVVRVTDLAGSTAHAEVTCAGSNPPSVTISCPSVLIDGVESTFTAVGVDPDQNELTYQWSLNGQQVADNSGDELTVLVETGDVVQVIAIDSTGLTSEQATASCTQPNWDPTVTVSCPDKLIYGNPATFTAVAEDRDGDPVGYRWFINGDAVAGATASTAELTVTAKDVVTVVASDGRGGSSAPVTADCGGEAENRPPTVALSCPDGLVWGSPAQFTAVGDDPDGDDLSYTWYVNSNEVADQHGAQATLVTHEGDTIGVEASDGAAASDTVDKKCDGTYPNRPPTVALTCPDHLVYGRPATFTAKATDPDGDDLTFIWSVNGTAVPGESGATAVLTVEEGQSVSVVAGDGSLASEPDTATCAGSRPNQPPTVTLTCPEHLVWGTPAEFRANGADPEGDELDYTWFVDGAPVDDAGAAAVELTVTAAQVVTVTATDPQGASTASAETNCAGNHRPDVALECPAGLVYGSPVTVTAVGTDADEKDTLTYAWKVNGEVLDGQNGDDAVVTLSKGDVVSVSVTDSQGTTSAAATSSCVGTHTPSVAITCPERLVAGEATVFRADGADEDKDSLTYLWEVNGSPIEGETGATISIALDDGDHLEVTATDPTGNSSATARADCDLSYRPTASLDCPATVTLGATLTFEVAVDDRDQDSGHLIGWTVNGEMVTDSFGDSLTVTATKPLTVSASAIDDDDLVSVTANADCVTKDGTPPPPTNPTDIDGRSTTRPQPNSPRVVGREIATALGSSIARNPLPYTGGPAGTLALVGVMVLGAGVAFTVASKRRAAAEENNFLRSL